MAAIFIDNRAHEAHNGVNLLHACLTLGFNLPYQSESYTMQVDRRGTAKTPFAEFDVLRVRTTMVRSFNTVPSVTIRSFNWNTECFGTVATVSSTDNESSTEFTSASEVRRLSN